MDWREPKVKWNINLGIVRLVTWYPYSFWNLTFGLWFWGNKPKVKCLQMYYGFGGAKCDGSRSTALQDSTVYGARADAWVYTVEPSEMWALRIVNCDRDPVWNNMGGA